MERFKLTLNIYNVLFAIAPPLVILLGIIFTDKTWTGLTGPMAGLIVFGPILSVQGILSFFGLFLKFRAVSIICAVLTALLLILSIYIALFTEGR